MKRTISSILAVVMAMAMVLSMTVFASAANNVALADLEAGFNNATWEKTADGLGVTLADPWTDTTGYGYTYWNLSWETIAATPYLVVDFVDDTMSGIGGWANITIGYIATNLQALNVAEKQVIDLRTLVDEGEPNLCVCFTMTATIAFDALYLTDDPNGGNGGNTETGVESAVAVAAAAVIGAGALIAISRKK